jgi:hypothetical protein
VLRPLSALAVLTAFAAAVAPGCSLGEGKGVVSGSLDVPGCWSGAFNLNPDFFAAVPYRKTSLILRIQNGGDYQNFSDGLSILVDDVGAVRGTQNRPRLLDQPLRVSLSPEVTPPGIPIVLDPDPARVHATLYLQRSCRTQNVTLHAVDQATLGPNGECGANASDGGGSVGAPPLSCSGSGLADASTPDAEASDGAAPDGSAPPAPAGSTIGRSTIIFKSIFNGDPDESDADERYIDATFDFYLVDPREVCAGGVGAPPPCRGHIEGTFQFFFQRGRPAQPFP